MRDIYSGIIILLISYHGVGKGSIARELSKLTGIKPLDQEFSEKFIHKIAYEKDGVTKKTLFYTSALKKIMLGIVEHCTRMEQSFIFAEQLFQGNQEHSRIYHDIEQVANKRGSVFVPIRLNCSYDEIFLRYENDVRYKKYRHANIIDIEDVCLSNQLISVSHPNYINLEISGMEHSRVASMIADKLERLV